MEYEIKPESLLIVLCSFMDTLEQALLARDHVGDHVDDIDDHVYFEDGEPQFQDGNLHHCGVPAVEEQYLSRKL